MEFLVGGGQIFGFDASFGYYGHEVGIAGPAREDMEVEVAGDAGASGAAEVHAKIVALGVIGFFQGELDALGQHHHLGERAGFDGRQVRGMLV